MEYSNFASLKVCGLSTAFLIFLIGIACLVISGIGLFDDDLVDCGQEGNPPLTIWILGTGIVFSVISCSFWRVSSSKGGNLAKWILGVSNLFVFVWAIVGIFSMINFGGDCQDSSPQLWIMAWATIVVSFLVCCCGGFVGYNVSIAEAEVVSEELP